MPVRYENPREVGADRIVNAVAAFEMVGGARRRRRLRHGDHLRLRVREGRVPGGHLPGNPHLHGGALRARSMLHRVEIARPKSAIGRTTTASLQSGLLFGYAGMVDAMVARIRSDLGDDVAIRS